MESSPIPGLTPGTAAKTPPAQDDQAGAEFSSWLNGLLDRLPPAPELPAEAFDRASIYED